MFIFSFLCIAGFLAGFIDSIAGGGGLITLPALIAVNVPPQMALGTNKFQSMLGTSFALLNFHRKAKVIWKTAIVGIPFALIGSIGGARLALIIPPSIMAKVIVILIPPLALFIFFSKFLPKSMRAGEALDSPLVGQASRLSILANRRDACSTGRASEIPPSPPLAKGGEGGFRDFLVTPFACLIIGLYDGFLGPGTGTFLILALVLFSRMPLLHATATAKTFNLASNAGAFATFILSGYVYFPYAIAMAAANIAGNIVGSHYAMKHGSGFIRKVLFVSLSILFGYLLWKYF